jgi:hypothetical protein
MARYSKVSRRVWGDEKFKSLSAAQPNAQTLWFRLLTAPEQTCIPGVLVIRLGGLADDLGWSREDLTKVFGEVFRKGMAKADWGAGLVWLPNASKHNKPESPNVIRGWSSVWDELPDSPLKGEIYRALVDLTEDLPRSFAKTFVEVFPKTWPNPEPEPEPDPEPDPEPEQEQEGKGQTQPPAEPAGPPVAAPAAGAVGVSVPGSAPPKPEKKRPAAPRHIGRETEVPETDGIGRARRHWAVLWHEKYGSEYPDAPAQDAATLVKLVQHHKRAAIEVPWRTWMADLFKAFLADPEPFIAQSGHPLRLLQTRLAKYEADRARVA